MRKHGLTLMLPFLIALSLALAVHYASAQSPNPQHPTSTIWGGTLPGDTTMHPAGNPHLVHTDLTVPAGVTLTVEPGTELRFAPGASLIVYGRLLAQGTPTQTIHFTARDAGTYWGAIAVIDSPADNRIVHAVIEYTREGLPNPRSHGVSAYNARLTLADSVLRYTQASAGVIADAGATLYLLRNEIHDVQGDAVHPTGGLAVIQGNHIYNARWGLYYYEGIEISQMSPAAPALVLDNHVHDVSDDCLDVNDSWVVVARNRLHHCADKGISLGAASKSSAQPSSATVANNLVYAAHEGVAVKDGTLARLVHNTVAGSGIGLALYEAHDHPGRGGGRATVVNTILWGNGQSISLDPLSAVTVTYSDVQGGWPGEGNLDADPLFQEGEILPQRTQGPQRIFGKGPTNRSTSALSAPGAPASAVSFPASPGRLSEDFDLSAGSPAINAGRDEGVTLDLAGRPRPVGRAPDVGAYERQSLLDLWARPGDARAYLAWQPAGADPALSSFAISYTACPPGSLALPPVLVTGLPTTTLAYTLSGLLNYAWYTVVVEGWDAGDERLMRSNLAVVMPTDRYVYLPLIVHQ